MRLEVVLIFLRGAIVVQQAWRGGVGGGGRLQITVAGAGVCNIHRRQHKEEKRRITGCEIALHKEESGCYRETEWMNYSESGLLLLHLTSSVCVWCFSKFSQFLCDVLSFSPLIPSRRGVATNPGTDTKDLALPSPTSVASDLSGHLASLDFGEGSQRYLKVKGSWKTFCMWQQKIILPLMIFCN